MSHPFSSTKLPDFLIEQFYDNLIISHSKKPEPLAKSISYLGDNKKNILILFESMPYETEVVALLKTVLTACKLDLSDVAILNLTNQNLSLNELKNKFFPRIVLIFGTLNLQYIFPTASEKYQPFVEGQTQILLANDIALFIQNNPAVVQEKKLLWNALKSIFKI